MEPKLHGRVAVEQSRILVTTITIKGTKKGHESMLDYDTNVAPLLIALGINEPMYLITRPEP